MLLYYLIQNEENCIIFNPVGVKFDISLSLILPYTFISCIAEALVTWALICLHPRGMQAVNGFWVPLV